MKTPQTILVIDDHFEILDMLRSLLELASPGCRVVTVPSAEEALLELRQAQCDLVISDVRLPGMDGLEFVRRVKALRPDTPLVMMSAFASEERQAIAAELGVVQFFPKPLDMNALLSVVQSVLKLENAVAPTVPSAETPLDERLRLLQNVTHAAAVALVSRTGTLVEAFPPKHNTNWEAWATPAPLSEHPETAAITVLASETSTRCCAAVGDSHLLLLDQPGNGIPSGTLFTAMRAASFDVQSILEAKATSAETKPAKANAPAKPKETAPKKKPAPKPAKPAPLPRDPELEALFSDLEVNDNVEDFWQEALASAEINEKTGLTYEQAKARGLLPPNL